MTALDASYMVVACDFFYSIFLMLGVVVVSFRLKSVCVCVCVCECMCRCLCLCLCECVCECMRDASVYVRSICIINIKRRFL